MCLYVCPGPGPGGVCADLVGLVLCKWAAHG
jgi:hypothetical protein